MDKEFVPYEQALALKELGFDELCIKYYWTDGMFTKTYESPFNYNKRDNTISAPLYQQAFRWFRENYDLVHRIDRDGGWRDGGWWICTILNLYDHIEIHIEHCYPDSYEEAELACLNKLIEIIQGGNNERD